jgi:hypothetical protein
MKRVAPGEWHERAIISIHGKFPEATVLSIDEAMRTNTPFGLTNGESGVIFSPNNFAVFEFNKRGIKSQDYLQDMAAFTDAVKMYLCFYDGFMPLQQLLSFPQLKLIEK